MLGRLIKEAAEVRGNVSSIVIPCLNNKKACSHILGHDKLVSKLNLRILLLRLWFDIFTCSEMWLVLLLLIMCFVLFLIYRLVDSSGLFND